jgi:methylenetetrahydrofolate dehydrogenase (NAD+)
MVVEASALNPKSFLPQPGAVVMNVSHFKNVDEASLLEIDNVKYCPLVGKVTVAMLERNLLRLIDNFHS